MPNSQIQILFNKISHELQNPINKARVIKYPEFKYDEFQSTITKYIKHIDKIYVADTELQENLIKNAITVLDYFESNGDAVNLKDFYSAAIFLNTHNPEDYPEKYNDVYINHEEFSKRYDKLISLLNDKDSTYSNLTLTTIDTNTPFKLFKNSSNSIVVKAGKEIAPMSVSKDKLKRVLYNKENYTYKSYEDVILKKLLDNSIFDLINEKPASAKGTRATATVLTGNEAKIEQLEQERLKTAGKISDLEDTLNSYKEGFENLNSILEESKSVKQDFESAKESALKDISLQLSYKFWENQAKRYNLRYWLYLGSTILLSVILLLWIFNYLEDNPFGKNSITPTIKQFVPQVESNKAKLSTQKDGNKSSTNKQSLATVENSKPILSAKKDSNQSTSVEETKLSTQKDGNKSSSVKVENNQPNLSAKKDSNQSTSVEETDIDKMMKFLHYGFLILLSSIAIWFIRILMKITLSNYHLSIDANERVIMIRTYLSLIKEGSGYDEKDKKVILDNIFRPTNHGIIKDESSVTVTDIISSFKK